MAAVMLAGAPLCNEAFAAGTIEAVKAAEDLALGNGVKFILDNSGNYTTVTTAVKVEATGVTYMTEMHSDAAAANATVFEVVNFQKNALGATFNLKVDGKLFALTTKAGDPTKLAMISSNTKKDNVYTTFTADLGSSKKYLLKEIKLSLVTADGSKIAINGDLKTTKLAYEVDDLNSFSKTGTTFSFGTEAVEGNIFASLTPITLDGKVAFVKDAKQEDITKFLAAYPVGTAANATKDQKDALEAAAKKLTFAAVTAEAWGLNTSAKDNGEGYKLALVNGAAFHGEKALPYQNAQFTITEGDQLNNAGEVEISAKVTVSKKAVNKDVVIKAVKASNSDPKTYVTTIAVSTSTSSTTAYAKMISPTMGGNTYFAASEFLKKDGISAYNIYFTSGKKSNVNEAGATEYHKYLAAYGDKHQFMESNTLKDLSFTALAADDIDLSHPLAQWIVTGFNGKYQLELTNRANGKTITLALGATDEAGVYDVDKATYGNTVNAYFDVNTTDGVYSDYSILDLVNPAQDHSFQIKLVPATVSKHDGFMQLSKADREEGLKLSFSGKSAQTGEHTYYAEEVEMFDRNNVKYYRLQPNKDASKAAALTFNEYEPSENEAGDYINVTDYIYLNAAGEMAAAKDTLAYPAYTISKTWKVGSDNKTYYLNGNMNIAALEANAKIFVIAKALNGAYQLVTNITYTEGGTQTTKASALGVSDRWFSFGPEFCMPYPENNTELAIVVNDNSDKTTLPAVSRHATFENSLGSVSMQVNKNGILEGILAAEPATFWLDTADSEKTTPSFYISKGIKAAEETKAYSDEVRNFLVFAPDSAYIFNEGSATETTNKDYILVGTEHNDLKAFFHPAALIAEDTMTTVVDGKEVTVVAKDADTAKNQINALKNFQFGICLADEEVADEYVIYSKANTDKYLYSHNGKLGFGTKAEALVVKLGEGDATANEAIAAENNVAVIAGEGVVTVKGAAGKQVVVSNILGQEFANKVATSDEETFAAAVGVVVVRVDGEATKVVVK